MRLGNWLKTTLLLTFLTLLFVLVGRALAGTTGLLIALGLALVVNTGAYWCSVRIALTMTGRARLRHSRLRNSTGSLRSWPARLSYRSCGCTSSIRRRRTLSRLAGIRSTTRSPTWPS